MIQPDGTARSAPTETVSSGRAASEVIVIFDFDKTLVSIDTGSTFITEIIRRSRVRTALAALAMPLAVPLFLVAGTRLTAISIFLWIGTVGMSRKDFDQLCSDFGATFDASTPGGRALGVVVEALREHVRSGHRVIVISGSLEALVQVILKRFVDADVEVIGSSVRAFGRGLIGHQHCVGAAKVQMALDLGVPDREWDVGYSDSASDIEIMRRCKRRILVNPTAKTVAAYRRLLGNEFEVIRCQG